MEQWSWSEEPQEPQAIAHCNTCVTLVLETHVLELFIVRFVTATNQLNLDSTPASRALCQRQDGQLLCHQHRRGGLTFLPCTNTSCLCHLL